MVHIEIVIIEHGTRACYDKIEMSLLHVHFLARLSPKNISSPQTLMENAFL